MKKFDLVKVNGETMIVQNDQEFGGATRKVFAMITQSPDPTRIGRVVEIQPSKAVKIGTCRFNVGSSWNSTLPH